MGRQQGSRAHGVQSNGARESASETLGKEPRWEAGRGRERGTEQDLTELGAAALTTAGLALVVGTQGDLLCLELRAADATLPPQPLVLAELRSAARLARACIRTCVHAHQTSSVVCVHPHQSSPTIEYACMHTRHEAWRVHGSTGMHAWKHLDARMHVSNVALLHACASAAMLARLYAAEELRWRRHPARREHGSPRAAPRNIDGGQMA